MEVKQLSYDGLIVEVIDDGNSITHSRSIINNHGDHVSLYPIRGSETSKLERRSYSRAIQSAKCEASYRNCIIDDDTLPLDHHHLSNHTATNMITGQFNHYTIVDSLSRGSGGGPTSLSGVYVPSCECIKRYIT